MEDQHLKIKKLKHDDGTTSFKVEINFHNLKKERKRCRFFYFKSQFLGDKHVIVKEIPDKYLESYAFGKPIKFIKSPWIDNVVVAALDDYKAVLPTNYGAADYLKQEMISIKQGWKQHGLPEWKYDPSIELSMESKNWLNTFLVRKSDGKQMISDQKLDKNYIYPVIRLFLKLLSSPCDGTKDQIILSIHHFDYFFNQIVKKNNNNSEFGEWYDKYSSAQRAYSSLVKKDSEITFFEIHGTKTEKIILEIQDEDNLISNDFLNFAKKTKNFIMIDFPDNQIIWNSKRNVGIRKIGTKSFLYIITTISQLNFWYFCYQNQVFKFMLNHLSKIHFAMKNKLYSLL